MQIVIDVPNNVYESTQGTSAETIKPLDAIEILRAFKNGKRLPKGHGDLIDKQELLSEMDTMVEADSLREYSILFSSDVENARAVIEADKEECDGKDSD